MVLLAVACALPAPLYAAGPALAASSNPVLADCAAHPGGLTGHYTVAQLRHALQVMSAETKEYTSCPDVINRALLAALGSGTSAAGGTGGGSGSVLPTPLIVVLVVLALAAVTFGAIAIRRRRGGVGERSERRDPPGGGEAPSEVVRAGEDTPVRGEPAGERRPAGERTD